MDFNHATSHDWDIFIDRLVAELTEAAYPVALRHGARGSWVDLELDLWKALGQTVKKWRRPGTKPLNQPERMSQWQP